ncbi:MAG TPA: 50S ribosomal protein L25/general stress protein Ctc [Xanthobacteraceae bacterium]|nr:50S ribosomal protein L25/general stress protein Ctc [Xanthobacteraceae bacterium]
MATVKEMKAMARPKAGKGAARAERRSGRVPGVIYGDSKAPLPISLDFAELKQTIYAGRFLSTIFDIEVDGAKHRVLPRDYQVDPVKDTPIHVDFLRLGAGATIRVGIPIRVHGGEGAPGVKRGGTVNIVVHTLELEVPADAIPDAIDIDISDMDINSSRHLSEVKLPANVKIVGKADQTLVTIVPPSGAAEEAEAPAAAAAAPAAAAEKKPAEKK